MKSLDTICPNCGGRLILSNDMKQKICPYCDSIFALSRAELEDTDESFRQIRRLGHDYLDIVCDFCMNYPLENNFLYAFISDALREHPVFPKAQKYFHIPENDEVYLIYNSSFLLTCHRGFAFCSSGIYFRSQGSRKPGKYTWEEFKKLLIRRLDDITIIIRNASFYTHDQECTDELYKFLKELQEII